MSDAIHHGTGTVLLTVDVDEVAPMLDEVPAERWSDHLDEIEQRLFGPRAGLDRVLATLRRYGLPATFYVPGVVAELVPDSVTRILDGGHEVGLHGWRHTSPRGLSQHELVEDIDRSVRALVAAGAPKPRGYRAPEWHVTVDLISALCSQGIDHDSSLGGYEQPYRVRVGRSDHELLELPVTWALDDAPFLLCTSRYFARPMDARELGRRFVADIDALLRVSGFAVLTVHPWIIGRGTAIEAFEAACAYVAETSGVEALTASKVADTVMGPIPMVDVLSAGEWWSAS